MSGTSRGQTGRPERRSDDRSEEAGPDVTGKPGQRAQTQGRQVTRRTGQDGCVLGTGGVGRKDDGRPTLQGKEVL